MSAKTKTAKPADLEELFSNDDLIWTVVPVYKRQTKKEKAAKSAPELSHYELRFGDSYLCHSKRKGEAGQDYLRGLAKFMNRQRIEPRRKIECAADSPNPDAFRQKLSGIKS